MRDSRDRRPVSSPTTPASTASAAEPDRPAPAGDARARPAGRVPLPVWRLQRCVDKAHLVQDTIADFCARFVDPRSAGYDDLIQAGRRTVQHLLEAGRCSAAQCAEELAATKAARAAFHEVRLGLEEFLRERTLPYWPKESPEAQTVIAVGRARRPEESGAEAAPPPPQTPAEMAVAYSIWFEHREPAVVANALICVICQTLYLVNQHIRGLEQVYVAGGGSPSGTATPPPRPTPGAGAESPTGDSPNAPLPTGPACPRCGRPMALRTVRNGPRTGAQFWGCRGYPECLGTRQLRAPSAESAA